MPDDLKLGDIGVYRVYRVYRVWGFPTLGVPSLGVPIMRIIAFQAYDNPTMLMFIRLVKAETNQRKMVQVLPMKAFSNNSHR